MEIGTVFAVSSRDQTVYWKITGEPYSSFGSQFYPVIKCSAKGKEYKDKNGYTKDFLNDISKNPVGHPVGWVVGVFDPKKANIDDGIESGKRIRRIQYLERKIVQFQKELEELKGDNNE